MLPKLVFSCFKLCLLVVLCTAAPAADSDLSYGSDNGGKIVKQKGEQPDSRTPGHKTHGIRQEQNGVDLSDLSDLSDTGDGKIVMLQGADNEDDAPDADVSIDAEKNRDHGVQDDNPDAIEEPINADEKDASVAEDPIDGEKNTDNEVQDDNPDTNQEPINADEKGTDPPIEDEKESENKSGENKIKEQDENDATSPSPSDGEVPNQSTTCYSGKNNVSYCKLLGFGLNPAEQIKFKIWPGGKIPYYIDELSYDKVLRDKIRSYLEEARSVSDLHFEELLEPPAGDDERWVFFINRRGQLDCKDYNTNSFTITGVQKVIIGYDCLEHGGPMAAVVLALAGVPPQHNSPDRDRYITVMTDHILPEKKGLFRRLKDSDWLFHDLEYDLDSVSHYLTHKYTADGSATIKILDQEERAKRKSADLGRGDIIPIGRNALMGLPFGDRSWMYNNEKRTYSSQDLLKLRFLYEFIVLNGIQIGMKPEDCKALYRPGPSFSKMKLKQQKQFVAKKKPKKYLDAVGNETGPDMLFGKAFNMQGEALSSLEK